MESETDFFFLFSLLLLLLLFGCFLIHKLVFRAGEMFWQREGVIIDDALIHLLWLLYHWNLYTFETANENQAIYT